MKQIKFIGITIGAVVLLFLLFLVHSTMSDFQPEEITKIQDSKSPDTLYQFSEYTALTWNLGYAGLDKDMDFFYDGGKQVRPAKDQVIHNIEKITAFLKANDSIDFILLQEVDISSKRSYWINEVKEIRQKSGRKRAIFGKNYDVDFVPVPPYAPMGKVLSGIVAYPQFRPEASFRYSFPGNYKWPKRIFMLDRCFTVSRYPVNNGKEFILINTHNSAFDDGAEQRKMQKDYLKEFIINEYQAGNYVMAGGDWNECPPGFKPEFNGELFDTLTLDFISQDFLPSGWHWGYGSKIPTNRRVSSPYKKGETLTTVIDFYLFSPNIEVKAIHAVDLNFENSDHQPVIAGFKIN